MITTCFFDMDGVLADFYAASLRACGLSYEQVRGGLPAGPDHYGYFSPFMSASEFWGKIDNHPRFWEGLPKLEDGAALMRLCQSTFGKRVYLLTSGPYRAAAGKEAWVTEHYPELRKKMFVGSAKEGITHPGALLIDDLDANVKDWRDAGGKAILVPRYWNTLHHREHEAVAYVTKELKELLHG